MVEKIAYRSISFRCFDDSDIGFKDEIKYVPLVVNKVQ